MRLGLWADSGAHAYALTLPSACLGMQREGAGPLSATGAHIADLGWPWRLKDAHCVHLPSQLTRTYTEHRVVRLFASSDCSAASGESGW